MSEESIVVLQILRDEQDKLRKRFHEFINETAALHLTIEAKIIRLEDKIDLRPPCNLHVGVMKEINDTVTRMEISNAATIGKLDGFMSLANRILEKIDKDLYSDGGLISKANKNSNQINLQWGILMILLTGAIGLFLWKH